MGRPTRAADYRTTHVTWVHQDVVKGDRPRVLPLIVECSACDWTDTGHTRRPDAKAAGERHEKESNA